MGLAQFVGSRLYLSGAESNLNSKLKMGEFTAMKELIINIELSQPPKAYPRNLKKLVIRVREIPPLHLIHYPFPAFLKVLALVVDKYLPKVSGAEQAEGLANQLQAFRDLQRLNLALPFHFFEELHLLLRMALRNRMMELIVVSTNTVGGDNTYNQRRTIAQLS